MSKETDTKEFQVYKQLFPYEADRSERASNENETRENRFENILNRMQKESGRNYSKKSND